MMKLRFFAMAAAVLVAISAHATLTGDVTGDGKVNTSDVTALVNNLLSGSTSATACDVNGDGAVNTTDVTALIDLILKGTYDDYPLIGGDISMLAKHEEAGVKYYAPDGTAIPDVIAYLKSVGWNAMRLRLFVEPSDPDREGVVQDLPYVIKLGKRIKDAGLKLVLDFHYSDTWADPSTQTVPSRWSSLTATQLADSVRSYTAETLRAMKAAGAEPDLVQVGNEVSYGMLWPTGHCWPAGSSYGTGSWANFASYLKAGASAVREVCPDAQVIVHVELGNSMSKATDFFKTATAQGIDFDIIGLSYYPYWHGTLGQLGSELSILEQKFPTKPIMIMETGYPYAWAMNDTKYDYTSTWAYSDAGQAKFATDLRAQLAKHDGVQGLFWWWPEQNEYGNTTGTQVTGTWWNSSMVDSRTGRFGTVVTEWAK